MKLLIVAALCAAIVLAGKGYARFIRRPFRRRTKERRTP